MEWKISEGAQRISCKTGNLHFVTNALTAPLPFQLILGQPFMVKERIIINFAPLKVYVWRGGQRLDLPVSQEERTTSFEGTEGPAERWLSRTKAKEAHSQLMKKINKLPGEEAKRLVRFSPKRKKNFKTAAIRAYIKDLVHQAKISRKQQVNAIFSRQQLKNESTESSRSVGKDIIESKDEYSDITEWTPNQSGSKTKNEDIPRELLQIEREYLEVPNKVDFFNREHYKATYEKFDKEIYLKSF